MANYLIIGGTSGIGYAVTKKLMNLGHRVFITGREVAKTETIARELSVDSAVLDATDFAAVDNVFMQFKSAVGAIDGVVNCAGSILLKAAHMIQQDEYDNVIAQNLTTAFAVVRAAGKHMAQNGGSVVLLSSAAALTGIANHEAIAAAKAGIVGLTLSAAATYAASQLRFNVVAPGLIQTPMTAKLTSSEPARAASIAMHALGRLGQPEEVASAVIFFLLPENSWVSGQVLAVDGGLSRLRPKLKM